MNSAAIIVYLAGKTRLATEESTFLMHGTYYGPSGYEVLSIDRLETLTKEIDQLNSRFTGILASNCKVPKNVIEASFRFPQTVPAALAVTYGLTHRIEAFATTTADKVIGL